MRYSQQVWPTKCPISTMWGSWATNLKHTEANFSLILMLTSHSDTLISRSLIFMMTDQRRLVTISVEGAFNYHAPYAMYYFCWLNGLTWVVWACRIGDQPPLMTDIQWNPSNPDTLGIRESGWISKVSAFQGLVIWCGCGLSLKSMMKCDLCPHK